MKTIKDKIFSSERALYGISDTEIKNCTFKGEEDGESALKECRDVSVKNCEFELRYPLWHTKRFEVLDSSFGEGSRAPIWYCSNGKFKNCTLSCVKAVRECCDVLLEDCKVTSPEFGWKSKNLSLKNTQINAEYLLLDSSSVLLDGVTLNGKYSFQYVDGGEIANSKLYTKDAFWHSKNLTVKNTLLKGEYLGWYSKNLTLINCHIIGTQPLCYCENLTLINCTMEDCDLSFEYSSVNATIEGFITSVKNVRAGRVVADGIGEIIRENSVIPLTGEIVVKNS